MGVIKFLIVKIGNLTTNFIIKYYRLKLKYSDNIEINNHARISHTAVIKIKYGGEINIGNSEILENVILQTYGGKINIGERCSINANTIIYGHGDTIIGDDVLIAGGCMVIPANHIFNDVDLTISEQGVINDKISIENNVWIGHGCSILAGVTIGEGSVVAAGSVVNKSIPKFSVVGGVPAKIIKSRL